MTLLDRFMISLGFHVEREGIEEFEHSLTKLKSSALMIGEIMTAAAVGVGELVRETAEGMNKIYEFAELNEVSAKSVMAWSSAGVEFGITSDAMQDGLGNLNRKLGEAAAGIGRGAAIFKKLHLSAKDAKGEVHSLDEMLGILADRMSSGNRTKNIAIAGRLGLDPHMVQLLEQGRVKLGQLRAEAEKNNPLQEEDFKKAHDTEVAFTKTGKAIAIITKQIAVYLMPPVIKALNYFLAWVKELRQGSGPLAAFNAGLEVMAAVVGTGWDWVSRLAGAVREAMKFMGQFRLVVWLAVAAVAALISYKVGSWFMELTGAIGSVIKMLFGFEVGAGAPLIAIGALIIAIGLLIDDLWNFYHGGDSVIGQLSKDYPNAAKIAWTALGTLSAAFIALKWSAITSMWETIAIMALYAGEWVATTAVAIAGAVATGFAAAALAVEWVISFGAMAIATLAALWPIFLVVAALVAVTVVVLLVMKHWSQMTNAMVKAWRWVLSEMKQGVAWLEEKLGWVAEKFTFIMSKIPGASKFFGTAAIGASVAVGAAQAPASRTQAPYVIGRAATGIVGAVTHHTHQEINAPITVISSDPDKAGKNVERHLDRKARTVTRNAQSAVAQ